MASLLLLKIKSSQSIYWGTTSSTTIAKLNRAMRQGAAAPPSEQAVVLVGQAPFGAKIQAPYGAYHVIHVWTAPTRVTYFGQPKKSLLYTRAAEEWVVKYHSENTIA